MKIKLYDEELAWILTGLAVSSDMVVERAIERGLDPMAIWAALLLFSGVVSGVILGRLQD